MYQFDIYRILYPKTAEYTLFSNGIFSRKKHMEGHKTSLKKF